MDIGYNYTMYTDLPSINPEAGEIKLFTKLYFAIKPNGNSGITYEKGKSGIKKVANYLKVYRPQDVLIKVISRSNAEKVRNDKWLVCGIGENANGEPMLFFHPAAQSYQSEIIVAQNWAIPVNRFDQSGAGWANPGIKNIPKEIVAELSNVYPHISGKKANISDSCFETLKKYISKNTKIAKPATDIFKNIVKAKLNPTKNPKGKAAVLFGYGNYARTITLPFLKPYVHLARVHEIDPALLITANAESISTDPLPEPKDFEYSVWMIAGYHHTHAFQATAAINGNIIPIIEKPIATSKADLDALIKAINTNQTPFYQCYQKRYQVYNDFIYKDLNAQKGDPINFKATVFEIPLSDFHWYNWPVSGSRIISNGCHWIDHFMYINDYVDWMDYDVKILSSEELLITIKLENGAVAVITLSDVGSNRIGMREYAEFSTHGFRVTIRDSMYYESESNSEVIRTYKTDKLAYLRKMYREIGQDIDRGGKGDSVASLKSTALSLLLEEEYQAKKNSEMHEKINF